MTLPPKRYVDLSLLALVLWLIGFLMAALGGHEFLESLRCDTTPSEISCQELDQQGPPANRYITLTGFRPNWDGYLYYADEQDGRWIAVDVPLFAPHSDRPPVVAILHEVGTAENLFKLLGEPKITGMLTQRGLAGLDAAALQSYCPQINTGACWVMTVGSRPQNRPLMGGLFAGGLLLHTLAVFLFARPRPQDYRPGLTAAVAMSPLLVLVDGLHAAAHKLPLSRRTWGLILLPPAMAAAAYGGVQFYLLAGVPFTESMGADLLALAAIIFGVTFSLLGLSFLASGSTEEISGRDTTPIVRPPRTGTSL